MSDKFDLAIDCVVGLIFLTLEACIAICFIPAIPWMIPGYLRKRRREKTWVIPADTEGKS